MRVLGLDPSLRNFGWALLDTEELCEDRCEAKGRLHSFASDNFVARFIAMREGVSDLLKTHKPDFVGVESPIFGESYSEGMYALFIYTCEALKSFGMNTVFFSNTQTKAHVRRLLKRPKGWSLKKRDMIQAAQKETTIGQWSSDEADAYWVAHLASRFWSFHRGILLKENLTKLEGSQFCLETKKKNGIVEKKGIIFRNNDLFFLWEDLQKVEEKNGTS